MFGLKVMLMRLLYRIMVALLRFRGFAVANSCEISRHVSVRRGAVSTKSEKQGRIILGDHTLVSNGVTLHAYGGEITLGRNNYIGPYSLIYGHGGVTVGNDCLIAAHCQILSANHTVPPLGTIIRSQPDIPLPTQIGNDVWLGAGVVVLGGVTIGDGCVVGAGAVVTKDLPSGSIAVGVPAKITGQRTIE